MILINPMIIKVTDIPFNPEIGGLVCTVVTPIDEFVLFRNIALPLVLFE